MKFKVLKSDFNCVVKVETAIDVRKLDYLSAKDRTLVVDNQEVFMIAYSPREASISNNGIVFPTKSFILNSDSDNIEDVKIKLATIKRYADKLEKQIMAIMKQLDDDAAAIEEGE